MANLLLSQSTITEEYGKKVTECEWLTVISENLHEIRTGNRLERNEKKEGKMAERTGLEPATPGVTGRYSNQLNYRSAKALIRPCVTAGPGQDPDQNWWVVQGSNLRPSACKADALPAELTTREKKWRSGRDSNPRPPA